MIAALMSLMLSLTPQDPTIVWSAPKAEPTPIVVTPAPAPTIDLPDWARADPYAWERAQCSPLLRGDEDLQACQARVRVALDAALKGETPAGLAVQPGDMECSQMATDGRAFDLACGDARDRLTDSRAYQRQREDRQDLCDRDSGGRRGSTSWNLMCSTPETEDRERGGLGSALRGD